MMRVSLAGLKDFSGKSFESAQVGGSYLVRSSAFCAVKQDRDKLDLKTFKGKCHRSFTKMTERSLWGLVDGF